MASLGPGRPKIRRASGSSHLQVILAAMTFVAATTAAYLAASHAQRAFVRMKVRDEMSSFSLRSECSSVPCETHGLARTAMSSMLNSM